MFCLVLCSSCSYTSDSEFICQTVIVLRSSSVCGLGTGLCSVSSVPARTEHEQ